MQGVDLGPGLYPARGKQRAAVLVGQLGDGQRADPPRLAMVSVLSQPISGRRIGSDTASSRAAMFGSVWLDTWPSESPVTSAPALTCDAKTAAVFSISRRCATT